MKPSIPKGTRDFLPEQVYKREYIFELIRKYFRRFGFQPIETPAMEDLQTLTGKYGEEGDKLLFKILNNGDFLDKADSQALTEKNSQKILPSISKRGLRYDLTVPFARYVVMHQNELAFPFKRYAMQPVWRADRPQKGRYQEFYQCDADVVGSDSLLYEAEFLQLFDQVFSELGLQVVIRYNHRKILAAMAEISGYGDRIMDITIAIDKLDKIGIEGVKKELSERGVDESAQAIIEKFLAVESLEALTPLIGDNEQGKAGLTELKSMLAFLAPMDPGLLSRQAPSAGAVPTSGAVKPGLQNASRFDVKLARGLNYYTGVIFEVEVNTQAHPNIKMGSIASGGRYADLTSIFGMKDMPGVGISFGAERIYDVLEELDLFPANSKASLQLLLLALDDTSLQHAFTLLGAIRAAGIHADIYPTAAKMAKMMKYANQRKAPKVLIIGSQEVENQVYTLKYMESGQQDSLTLEAIIRDCLPA